jgi:hypothetical protein
MKRVEDDRTTQPQPRTPDEPWKVLDEMREAFKDEPPEVVEREVARAIEEGRKETRLAQRKAGKRAPRTP